MAEKNDDNKTMDAEEKGGGGGAATAAPKKAPKKSPKKSPPQQLPPWKVMLHNDDKNDMLFVIRSIIELTPLQLEEAKQRMLEAHESGVALLLVTHKERAELYQDQFKSKGLTVTIEPSS